VLEVANTCAPPPVRDPKGLPHADGFDRAFDRRLATLARTGPRADTILDGIAKSDMGSLSPAVRQAVRAQMQQLQTLAAAGGALPYPGLLALVALFGRRNPKPTDAEVLALLESLFRDGVDDGSSFRPLAETLATKDRTPPCRPVDLTALADALADAIDPTGPDPPVVNQVLATITGLDGEPLTPPQAAPDIELSFWRLLRDEQPDWLLPGGGRLEPDSVVAVETNAAFVDAFLVGANTQALAELRWRNVPVRTAWTPLRSFWDRIDGNARVRDIVQVEDWPAASPLGATSHQTTSASSTDLVLVFRSALFHRYPSTLVYLFPPRLVGGDPDWNTDPDFAAGTPRTPIFQGTLGGELTFFAFDIAPADARELWVVLEEVPSGFRFRNVEHPDWSAAERTRFQNPSDSADFADVAFADPTRVLIRGDSLVPEV
jgi:hypothetical protein